MNMHCGYTTLKTTTITYNIISAIAGIALLVLGVTHMDEAADYTLVTGETLPRNVLFVLIIIGLIFISLRFIGLLGFWYEKHQIVRAYAIMSLAITVPLLLIAYMYRGQEDELADKGYYGIIKYFKSNWNKTVIHEMQIKYECCGDASPKVWRELPESCCLNGRCDVLNTLLIGCAPMFYNLIKTSGSVVQWTALGVSLAGFFGVFLSRMISNRHKNGDDIDDCRQYY